MEHIGKALDGFIKNSKIEKGLEQSKALSIWADVVGDKIAENSDPQSIDAGVLIVRTKTPAWRQELQLQKKEILENLNTGSSNKLIKDIRFV